MKSTKKNILFITHLYYPSVGGAERVFQRIAEGLAERGNNVSVLTSDALSTEQFFSFVNNNLASQEIVNGVQVLREHLNSNIYKALKIINPLNKLGRVSIFYRPIIFGPHFYDEYKKILGIDYDVIIAGPTPTSSLFYGLYYKRRHPQSKFIIFPHMHIDDKLHNSPVNIWALKKAEFVLALTDIEKKSLILRGIKEERIVRIVNGVDDYLLQTKPKRDKTLHSYVLYLGQEGGHKRIPFLIKTMMNIWNKGYKNKLVIAGARTYFSPALDKLIEKLPNRYSLNILRFNDISEEQKLRFLDNCLMLVNPSSYEAFGIVFLEAWARGKPVIGAKIKAVREIVRYGYNGLLFDGKIKGDLEEKILKLIDDKKLAQEMGQSGYNEVKKKYIWSEIVEQIESFL